VEAQHGDVPMQDPIIEAVGRLTKNLFSSFK